MRPWKIALTAAACALLIDVLVVRLVGSSPLTVLLGIVFFALLVLLITTSLFVIGLRKIRWRLTEPPRTREQWVAIFAGTGLERLGHRILDLVSSDASHDPEALLLQRPLDPSKARREIAILFRDWLIRAQFFTGLALLLTISMWSMSEWYFPTLVPRGVVPVSLSIAVFLAVSATGIFSYLAVGSTTEP